MYTNISDLRNKVENEGMTEQGRLSASEFNRLIDAVIENQASVKTVSLNGADPVAPDEEGNLNLTIALGDYEQVLTIKYNGDTLSGGAAILSADGNVTLQVQYKESAITQGSGGEASYSTTGQIVTLTAYGVSGSGELTTLFSRSLMSVGHDSTVFTDISLRDYLSNGEQSIQIRITNTINANPLQQMLTVVKANLELRVEDNAGWYRDAKIMDGTNASITARYIVLGNVTKKLHVKFTGASGNKTVEVSDITSNDPNTIISAAFTETTSNNIGFFGTNGVRNIEAWITCTYGSQTVESNHIYNQIIVVADQSTATTMIAVQKKITSMANYETETLFWWNMYNPALSGAQTCNVLFTVSNQDKSTVWLTNLKDGAENNTLYEFSQNISIEASGDYIDVYVFASINDVQVGAAQIAYFQVDNTIDYSPVSGADFYLNPGLRSNAESQPAKIINASTNQQIANCVFTNMAWQDGVDGWMTVNNRRVLRVAAGGLITIPYNIYSQFLTNSRHYLTIEIDFACRNVTNESDPVITMGNRNASNPKGVYINPLNGAFVSKSQTLWENSDVSWQENVRTHLVFNICHNYTISNPDPTRGTDQPLSKTLALVRTYINGIINKEYSFPTEDYDEINAGGDIVLGQAGCDLDIYCIRIYKDTNDKPNLGPSDVIKNYISTLPTGAERSTFKSANDLLQGGLISLTKALAAGYNCIVWHGLPVNKNNDNGQKRYGYAEIYRFNADGSQDRAHSGILYGIEMKGQGTTAMGYAEWNFQYKEDKKTGAGHDEYKYNTGSALKNVFVDLDGNANSKFGYKLESSDPLGKKLVGKINYASSMQSHKMGACNLYNDLYREICGSNSVTTFSSGERVTVKEEPFLYLVQRTAGTEDSLKVFQGLCTFGPGKADKPTWGVSDDDLKAGDSMLEGSLNNNPLGDTRVPFVDNGTIKYSVKNEAFMYAGAKNLNFSFGDTADLHDGQGAWNLVKQDGDEPSTEVPTTAQVKLWQPIINFLYLCNVGIKPWSGTPAELTAAASDDDFDYKSAYWMNSSGSGYNRFDLYRCHYTKNGTEESREFVPAGIRLVQGVKSYSNFNCLYALGSDTSKPTSYTSEDMWYDTDANGVRNLTLNIKSALEAFLSTTISTDGVSAADINTAFKTKLADVFDTYVSQNLYLVKVSHLFHHEIMKLLAGTDNRSKNTYYRLNPKANPIGSGLYRPNMEMNDDDLDTIFKTNNAGIQSKPYYILEHDVDGEGRTYWDGQDNALNNTLEACYGRALGVSGDRQNGLQSMMNTILTRMVSLVQQGDVMPDGTAIPATPLGCMDKYFFKIQKYFPAVAYNETARIRYEVQATFYMSEQPAQAPLTQSLGDQHESEREYVKRRIIMLAGYAGYEMDMLSFRGYLGNYQTTLVPHYWLYPMSKLGNPADTPVKSNVRVEAGTSYTLQMGTAVSGNTIFLHFINELSDIGNIGTWGNGNKDGDASTEINFTSERLKSFKCYGASAANVKFPLGVANISGSTKIEEINCRNCSTLTAFQGGISNLMRLKSIDLRGTQVTSLVLPQTTALKTVRLPEGFTAIGITHCPNLTTLSVADFSGMTRIAIAAPVNFNTLEFVMGCYSYNITQDANVVNNINLTGIDWSNVTASFLNWLLTVETLNLTGRIHMKRDSSGQITFALKKKLIEKLGNVDSEDNALYIDYEPNTLGSVQVTGDGYFDYVGEVKHYDLIPNVASGNTIKSYAWTISGGSSGIDPEDYVSIDEYGNVTCLQMGVESGGTGPTVTIQCVVTLTNNTTLTAVTMDIRCYFRQARIGDYVYHDGTWDDRLNVSKSVIGICFYCKKVVVDGGAGDWYDRRMVACANVNSRPWGLYPNGANKGSNGFASSGANALKYKLNGVDTDPWDVPLLGNVTSSSVYYTTYANMIDTNNLDPGFPENDPQRYFKQYDNNTAVGRFNLVEMGQSIKSDVFGSDTLYTAESMVPQGLYDTACIIRHRNNVLSGTTYDNGTPSNPDDDTNYTYFKPSDDDRGNLSDKMLAIKNFAANTIGDTYTDIYMQYLYPAASECFAYEPSVSSDNALADKFKCHHWYLPSIGELARLCFLSMTCYSGSSIYEDSAAALFGDIFANAVTAGKFTRMPASDYWSSTEGGSGYAWVVGFSSGYIGYNIKCNTGVVRPVAAF